MEPGISLEQREHNHWRGSNDVLKQYYSRATHSNLDYQFGVGAKAVIGGVNETPAPRADFFQGFTWILSKILWLIPLALSFAYSHSAKRVPMRIIHGGRRMWVVGVNS